MARFKLGEIMMDIRGSVRNHVYSVWNGTHYLRTNAEEIGNPKTEKTQDPLRARIDYLSKQWHEGLTDAQRAGWEVFAKAQGSKGLRDKNKGENCIIPQNLGLMSGYNAYLMLNLQGWSVNPLVEAAFYLADAPIGYDGTVITTAVTASYNAGTGAIDITYNIPASYGAWRTGMTNPAAIRVWHKPPGGLHSRIGTTMACPAGSEGAAGAASIPGIVQYGISLANPPGHHIICIDSISSFGLKSAPSAKLHVIVPQPSEPPP